MPTASIEELRPPPARRLRRGGATLVRTAWGPPATPATAATVRHIYVRASCIADRPQRFRCRRPARARPCPRGSHGGTARNRRCPCRLRHRPAPVSSPLHTTVPCGWDL